MTCPTKTLLTQRVTPLARRRQEFIDEILRVAAVKTGHRFVFKGDDTHPYMG